MNTDSRELQLTDIFDIVWKNKFLIAALAILFGVLAFFYVRMQAPQYQATGVLYITNKEDTAKEEDTMISKSDIDSSRSMLTTYLEILKTRSFLTDVSKAIDYKYSWKQIAEMISMSAVNETELLSVKVTTTDPRDSLDIVNAVMSLAPGKLIGIFKGGSVEIVDHAVFPQNPINNGLSRTVLLGIFGGAALGVVIAFLIKFFDKKVHKASELTDRYNISVLGEIRR